jgi:predicted nucleic acid-binding protein
VRYLLDTNVISEWIKPQPDAGVVAWLAAADEDALHVSVLVFAEIRLGIELLPPGQKRSRLGAWLDDDLAARFEGRIIGVDRRVAEAWGALVARGRSRGTPPPVLDAFLAATALVHEMTLVTRNEREVAALDVAVLNPWQR